MTCPYGETGRRAGFRSLCPQGHPSSSLGRGTPKDRVVECDNCDTLTVCRGPYCDAANDSLWLCVPCRQPYDLEDNHA